MRFIFGPPQAAANSRIDSKPIAISFEKIHIVGYATGVFIIAPTVLLVWAGQFSLKKSLSLFHLDALGFFSLILLTMVLHEVIHALSFAIFGKHGETIVGYNPKMFTPYITHSGILKRNDVIICALLPFLIITPVTIILVYLERLNIQYGSMISIFNAIGSGSDVYLSAALLKNSRQNWFVSCNAIGPLKVEGGCTDSKSTKKHDVGNEADTFGEGEIKSNLKLKFVVAYIGMALMVFLFGFIAAILGY